MVNELCKMLIFVQPQLHWQCRSTWGGLHKQTYQDTKYSQIQE